MRPSGRGTIRTLKASRGTIAPPSPARTAVAPARVEAGRTATEDRSPWWERLAVALVVALFVAIAARQWHLPGLYNDEAYDVVPAMQLVLGQPVELNRGVGLHLFGRALPLMISDYQGVTSMYGVLPLFAIFGVGVGPIRAFTIGLGALAIWLTYRLGRRLFGRPVGIVAAMLLATSPSFIFWSRVGVYVVIQVVPLALGATLCFLRWRRGGRGGWLALAGLLVGLGLSTKLLFLWFIGGVAAAGAAVWLVDWRWPVDRHGRARERRSLRARLGTPLPLEGRALVAAGAGFLLGAAPLLGYNLASGGTFKVLRANLVRTEKGANNLAFGDNLLGRADAFKVVLEGSYFWFWGRVHTNPIMLPLFLVSAVGLLTLVCAVPQYRRYRAATVFALAMLAAILVQSAFTLSGLEPTHLLLLLPLPQLVIAAFVVLLGRALARAARRTTSGRPLHTLASALPALLLLAPALAGDLVVDARYHRTLAEYRGKSGFSASIYDLAHFLDKHSGDNPSYTRPYALDWGMKYNIHLLTEGRIDPQEIYGQTPDPPPSFYATIETLLDDPYTIYLAHRDTLPSNPTAYHGRVEALTRLAEGRGKEVVTIKVIDESNDGGPVFYVYAVRDR